MLDDSEFDIILGWGQIKIFNNFDLITSIPKRHSLYFLDTKHLLGQTLAILNGKLTLLKL